MKLTDQQLEDIFTVIARTDDHCPDCAGKIYRDIVTVVPELRAIAYASWMTEFPGIVPPSILEEPAKRRRAS
jgi:hypothetical protein